MEPKIKKPLQLGMIAAVAAVFFLAYADLRREQARALEDFTAEQSTLAESCATTLRERIERIQRDLDTAVAASATGSIGATLTRIVGDGRLYREADLLDASGKLLLGLPARPEDRIVDSPVRRERLRRFEASSPDRKVVFLVDSHRLFEGLAPRSAANPGATPLPMRWLVVDEKGRWLELGSPDGNNEADAWHVGDSRLPNDLAETLRKMVSGAQGAMLLGREDAAFLGLERRSAIAGFAPVPIGNGRHWSLGVITSAMRVRDRARVSAWRLAAATGLAGLFVGLFGLIVTRQQRRAQSLAEALRLAEATAALRERSEKIVEAIPIGVLALNRDLQVTSVNPYLSERKVTAGSSLSTAFPRAGEAEIARLTGLVEEARATHRPAEQLDLRLRVADGEVRDVDAIAIPLSRPLADIECFLVLHDRTEIRVLERNLIRAEKLATIGTLAAGVAHEIGTPLGIISGRAEQVLAKIPDGDPGEAARKGLSSILTQVDKVSTTIRQLLDFARVRPIEASAVTPTQALSSSTALLEHRFRQSKVSLDVSAPPSVPAVSGDPAQLEQVFVNLLINAVDACAAGGKVRASAFARGDRVTFEISDDGCGIPQEHLRSVLDPFFTTKKRGQGTGLGLTIAADIIKNHGGTLEIDSAVGQGTTVRFSLATAQEST